MNLFHYTDYRAYLKDFYQAEKEKKRSYSYRVFANRAKLSSPNYLKLVIDGKRRITEKMLPRFVKGLRLSRYEAEFFRSLVLYQETEDLDIKNTALEAMLSVRRRVSLMQREMDHGELEMMRHWHHWAIREMLLLEDFCDSPKWVAERLHHRITPKEAFESLELLKKLGFIRKEEGRLIQSEPILSTTDEISSLLLRKLHRQFIELALHSLFNDPLEKREINGLTIAIPRERVCEIKHAIKEFGSELNRRFSAQVSHEVYQVMIHFFPLTQ